MSKTYTVLFERDEAGWWVASVKEVKGCHTQGKSIKQAEARIRDALGLFVKDADSATLERVFNLPGPARQEVAAVKKLEELASRLPALTLAAVETLTRRYHLSRRDAGAVLGLSHQRVQQLVAGRRKTSRGRRRATA